MSDAMTELFTAALGMAEPWRVESVRFDREAHEIHFDVVCKATRLPCPRCATPDQPIHDRKLRDWQHLHFFQYRALIHAELPRVRCSVCGERGETEVQQVAVPWARARSDWSAREVDLHWLRHSGLKTARAWRLKERLRDILAWRRLPQVPVLLLMDGWIRWARRCRLPAFQRLGKTFQTHLDGIRNMLIHANSNAAAESINADIQGAIARARGFRTFRNLRTIVYLLKARLDLPTSPFRPART